MSIPWINLSSDTKVNNPVTLTMTFILQIAILDFVGAGGIHVSLTGSSFYAVKYCYIIN